MRREKLAGLDVVVAGGDDRNGGGAGPLVVLLHGFGAPAEDLVPLAWHLQVAPGTRFVCPAAPLTLGLPFADARAWWLLDAGRIARGEIDTDDVPPGLEAARARVLALLDAAGERLGARPERTVIGGFSQGAMLAADVVLRTSLPFAGLVLLSATIMCEREWAPRFAARRGLRVFQSHGRADPLLPHAVAQRLRALWEQAGADVSFVSFDGGHDIPPEVVAGLEAFLTTIPSWRA